MIIDKILDRKDGCTYNAHDFYWDCHKYNTIFEGIANDILYCMDEGDETDVRLSLCRYILRNGYNPELCDYICSVKWLS